METRLVNKEFDNKQYLEINNWVSQVPAEDLSIVEYMKMTDNGEAVITLYSQQLFSNQVKVSVRGEKIILIISEYVDARKTAPKAHNTWEVLNKHSYTRIHNIRIMLPGDNFYILRNYEFSDQLFLKIILRKSIDN